MIVLLSVKAGLRAGEIAGLTWDMVLEPTGTVGTAIEVRDAKKHLRLKINLRDNAIVRGQQSLFTSLRPSIVLRHDILLFDLVSNIRSSGHG